MLNKNGESGYTCLVPHLRGNAFNFSPLRMMFAVGLSYMAFTMLRLEKEMATHSSVLAWRISATGEPGGVYGVAQSWTRLKRLSSSSMLK